MKRLAYGAVAVACLVTACARISTGVPVSEGFPRGSQAPSTRAVPTPHTDPNEPGVLPTQKSAAPAAITCAAKPVPPVAVMASVPDPAAPKVTVALPTGWSTTRGDGEVGAVLNGPDGSSAKVTISRTPLDPAAAFRKYTDAVMLAAAVSNVSVLPADLCGYSGQKLLGSWSDSPQQAKKFGDRLAHVWTANANYLVAVHVEGPTSAAGFEPNQSPLMDDFGIVIP